ncbi:hypothetical protein ABEV55_16985 [Aneurinibacillus thermoaerophilus]|uniref:hypothetical protein n=1 Tax=Aneurinibacillus thermoaerophilus TaxID=143495 RepID=UPI002E1A6F04|nr:hypothetical protein [Aneurinibacillus thermoaerophilus]
MAYEKQTWIPHIVDPNKPLIDPKTGKQAIDPNTGRVLWQPVQEGTRFTPGRMNHMEEGIEQAHILIEQLAKEWGGNFVASPNGAAGFQFSHDGLTVSWTAGIAYVNGRRLEVPAGSMELNPTQGQYIYLDTDGTMKKTTSQATAEAGLLLWYFATDASQVITSTDKRKIITPDTYAKKEEVNTKFTEYESRLQAVEKVSGDASKIKISDSGNRFNATDVEGALAEVMDKANAAQMTANQALPKTGGAISGDLNVAGKVWLGEGFFKDANGNWDTFANLKSSVVDGKNAIASAINGKGVSASGSDSFSELANKILQIPVGKPAATGSGSASSNLDYGEGWRISVSGIGFEPNLINVLLNSGPGSNGSMHLFITVWSNKLPSSNRWHHHAGDSVWDNTDAGVIINGDSFSFKLPINYRDGEPHSSTVKYNWFAVQL